MALGPSDAVDRLTPSGLLERRRAAEYPTHRLLSRGRVPRTVAPWMCGAAHRVHTIAVPTPRDGEVLVRVVCAGICETDLISERFDVSRGVEALERERTGLVLKVLLDVESSQA